MTKTIGIRKETKDKTQRRVPLSPDQVRQLIRKHKIKVLVEPWERRVFSDEQYKKAGAELTTDLTPSNIIFGVKEVAPSFMIDGMPYCFFSHTIKGQAYNMPMLRHILERKNSLFDYELVKDEQGKRLIFFGDYAGYAGMIDSLWALGRRLQSERIYTAFSRMKYATEYESLDDARAEIHAIGGQIWKYGLPKKMVPLIAGFTGYGRVSSAAQELFDLLPTVELKPEDLHKFFLAGRFLDKVVYKVCFHKEDMFRHKQNRPFNVREFQKHPERYTSRFEQFVPYLTLIVNGIYWEPRYPRLVTKRFLKGLYTEQAHQRLRVIGDITCDIEGSIEMTVKETDATNPVYVYEAKTGAVRDGFEGRGPVILAVDKLPAELPREASESFGRGLMPFVPALASANFGRPAGLLRIPKEFRNALIAHNGRLCPPFRYLTAFLRTKDRKSR